MDISRYIVEYIQEHPKLIVPGLGTFYKEDIPARFDATQNSFLPPSEKVSFKAEFSADSALQQFIATKETAKPKSIAQFIEQYVSNLNDLLANTEEIKIDGLGTFTKKRNKLHFLADKNLKNNAAFFGLKAIKETAPFEPIPQESIAVVEPEEPVEEPKLVEEEANTIPHINEEEQEEEPTSGGLKKALLFILIVILTGLAIVQSFFPSYLDAFWPQTTAEKIQVDSLQQQANPVTALDSTVNVDSTVTQTDTALVPTPTSDSIEPSFEIIVAAFHKQSEADEFIQQLAGRGIQAHSIQTKKGGLLKISIGTFSNEQSANEALQKTHTELAKNAWIYRVKPIKTN